MVLGILGQCRATEVVRDDEHVDQASNGDDGGERSNRTGVVHVPRARETLLALKDVLGRTDRADRTGVVVSDRATSSAGVSTHTGVGKRAGVEWDDGEIGAGWIGTPILGFDDRGVKANFGALAFLGGALDAVRKWRQEKTFSANALCRIEAT